MPSAFATAESAVRLGAISYDVTTRVGVGLALAARRRRRPRRTPAGQRGAASRGLLRRGSAHR